MYNFTLTVSLHYLMKLKADEIVSDTFMYYDDSVHVAELHISLLRQTLKLYRRIVLLSIASNDCVN